MEKTTDLGDHNEGNAERGRGDPSQVDLTCVHITTSSGAFTSVEHNVRQRYTGAGLRDHMVTTVPPAKLEAPLYLQAFATGVLDATTYADFGTFASNQTGNTILLTLAALDTVPVSLKLTGASLASFIVLSFIAGHVGHAVGHRVRWWLLLSCAVQMAFLSAIVMISYMHPDFIIGPHNWVIMMALACSAGVQVAMARHVDCPEIPTAMLSSPLVDFVTDQNLFRRWSAPEAAARNRRAIYVLSIISGSVCGAALRRYQGTAPTVLFAIGVKLFMAILILVA